MHDELQIIMKHRIRMNFIFKAAAAAAVSAAALLSVSCGKDSTGLDTPQTPEHEVLGTYEFDGKTYDILTATFEQSGNYCIFLFSPLAPDGEISTYFVFAVNSYWADGEEHKVANDYAGENLDHNDDYMIIYEDPVHYYSQFREPADGSFTVTPTDGSYMVRADILLADGTPLSIDYDGNFSM